MALNFLNNGVFAGDVTIPEYIYHAGDANTRFGFSSNDNFLVETGGINMFGVNATTVFLKHTGNTKLITTSTGVQVTGIGSFSGDVTAGALNTAASRTISILTAAEHNSVLKFRESTNNYGFTQQYQGTGNYFELLRHDNNASGNTVYRVARNSDNITFYGNILLANTGRIQGIDTVSAGTDAANKTYVDNAISGVPQGTVTISGTPVNNQLAVWTSATSIEGEAELTYDGSTFTVGGTGNTTTFLDVIGTNTAGAPATAAAIRIYGYEGRGEGIFYYDSAYAAAEWYSGIPYGGGNTYQIGYDATGGQAQYTANAVMTMDASKNTFFAGNVDLGDSSNITMAVGAPGQLRIKGSGYSGAIALDATAMYIYHDSSLRDLVLGTNEVARLTIDGSSGNATFAGSLTIPDYVIHTGDPNTYFGFGSADAFRVVAGGSEKLHINTSGLQLGGTNARVSTIYDQDNMSSNSATALATQQSIKQYVDTAVSNAGTVTGTGSSGRVAFWNGTSSIASNSTLSWDDGSGELGIGTSSATTSLTIAAGHSTTRANLYYNGSINAYNAYIDMWASEPGVSYNGSGIGSNINGSPHYGRKVTEQGQTYIRFIDGQFEIYTGTNSSGTSSTGVKRFQINDTGVGTFYTTPEVGTRSAGDNTGRAASTAFVTTAIGNVSTGVQSVGGTANRISSSGGTAPVIDAITGTVNATSTNLATGAQIQTAINTAIGTIPSGLAFEGNWNADTDSPDLSGLSPNNGQFWIVTVAGDTDLDGIDDWEIGDWAIYVATGAGTDGWQKVDNSSTLSGDGVATQLTYWTDTSNVAGDGGLTYDASANKLTVAGNLSAAGYNIFGLGLSTGSWYGDLGSNGYTRETGLTMTGGSEFVVVSKSGQGSTLVDGAYLAYESSNGFFGSYNSAYGNLTGIRATAANTLTVTQLDGGTANLAITSIANVTTDTDKFLVSDSGVVKYRTGAEVLSDIGAQASGNYLPVANPTFTGTLTGPIITTTGLATIGGAVLSGDTFSDPDLVLTVLDTDTTQSVRDKIVDSTTITKVSDSTAPAPGVFAVNGSEYPQGFGPFYTIDEGDTFTFEFWVKKESGAATSALLYAGSNFYNASGTYLGNSQRYWGESGLQVAAFTDWYHVSGTLGPARGSNTSQIPTTAVSMRLLFLFNYNANASIVTHYCGLKVYKSSKTVTQLYRKTLGSEASTARNRDLVVDQNGDLYGSKINATGNVTFAAGLQVTSPGTAFYNKFRSGNDYVIGLQDSGGDDEWWLKAYTNGSFALHENNVGDKFTIAAGGATTIGGTLTVDSISNASASNTFLVSDSGLIKYRTAAQVLSDIGAASSGSLGNYLLLTGGTMSGTIVSTATTALEMDGAAAAQGILMQADSSGTYPVFLRAANPASGGETSPWLYKEASAPWGIWHNNSLNAFDFTRSGNNLGIANNVGGQTNSVMIRLTSSDGSGTFAGNVTSSGDVTADQFFSTNNGNGTNYKIGDDVWIGDINLANTFRVQGAQTPANGYITFGNSSNTQLGRAGTGALTWGGDFEVTGYATITGNATVNGKLKVANRWDNSTLANNAIYAQNTTDGFAFGVGTDISTWFAWDSTQGQNDMISISNDGSKVTIHENLYLGNVDTSSNGTSALVLNSSGTNEVEKRTLGTGAFGPTPVGAYLPLVGGTLTGGLTGTFVTMTGGIKANEGMFNNVNGLRLINPGGGSAVTQTSTVTGAIKITLPVTHTNTMLRMTIKVYEYTTNESFTVVLGGYNYSSGNTWYNCFAHIESNATVDRNFSVRFGYASSKGQIYIGELNSQWSYPQVFVTDFQAGYSAYTASSWQTGWAVNFETSAFGSVTRSITNCQVNNWARDGVNINYTSGGGNVLVTTQPAGNNTTRAASTAFVTAAVAAVPIGNYVTLATAQTISGAKTFTGITQFNEHTQHGDQVQARWGAGNDLAIFHNGTNNYIASVATDTYYTGSAVTGTSAYSQIFKQTNFNGGDEEYLRISGPTRQVLFSRDAKFIDGIKCTFGTSATSSPGDLEIYHDGTDSIIENTNGDLYIINESLDKDVIIQSDNGATGEVTDYFRADGSTGSAILYGNYGTVQLTTNATGIETNTIDATVSAGSAGNFVVMDGTRLASRTAAQVLSDIGAAPSGSAMTGFGVSNLPSGTGTTFTITNGQTFGIVGGTNIQSVVSTANETITLNYTGGTGSGSVTSVATGGGLDGGTITTTGTIEVEYDGVSTNIMQSGFDYRSSTIVQGDYIMVTNPGDTGTYRRVGYTKVGQLPFTNNSGTVTSVGLSIDNDDAISISSTPITSSGTIQLQFEGDSAQVILGDGSLGDYYTGDISGVTAGTGLTGGGTSGTVTLNVIGGSGITANANDIAVDSTVIRTTGGQTRQGNNVFAATSTSTSYSLAGVELRESNLSGSSGTPPFLGFHWGGVVASSIAIEANGTIAIRNNPGNAYERFACGNLTAHGGTFLLGSGGVGDMYLGNQSTGNYFRFHTNNSQTYFDMNCGQINWRQGSSTRYYFYPSTANMTINGTLTQNSDSRVKENVVEIDNCISKVQAMRGVYYNRTDFNTEVTKVGVIAQEVEAVLPELILEASDTGLKSVAYAELTAVLINAIKEQQEIIEDLKTRIIKLEK